MFLLSKVRSNHGLISATIFFRGIGFWIIDGDGADEQNHWLRVAPTLSLNDIHFWVWVVKEKCVCFLFIYLF
jgi:hypothetical protein